MKFAVDVRRRRFFFIFCFLPLVSSFHRCSPIGKMLRAKGAAGYAGFNSQGSELPRTNGRGGSGTYAGGGGRKGAAARRRRLLSRLGIVVAAAMVLYLLARSRSSGGGGRGAGGKGGGGASEIREVQKSTQVHNLNIEETAKAAEAR